MEFVVNDNVDQERTAFLAYSALQSAMNDYTGDGIDSVVRLDYLAPTPTDPNDSNDPESAQTTTGGVSPLAIGAAAALVAGGTLALFVWHRNRSTRNKRHVELEEDEATPCLLFPSFRLNVILMKMLKHVSCVNWDFLVNNLACIAILNYYK